MRIANFSATALLCATVIISTACAARPESGRSATAAKTEATRSNQTQTGSDDERQVCELRKTLGSNKMERVCTTQRD
jgi:hypothetical protein